MSQRLNPGDIVVVNQNYPRYEGELGVVIEDDNAEFYPVVVQAAFDLCWGGQLVCDRDELDVINHLDEGAA